MSDSEEAQDFLEDEGSDSEELVTIDEDPDDFSHEDGEASPKIKYQEDVWQLKKLPYATELFEEAAEKFAKIKTGLARAVLQKDVEFGLDSWLYELHKYLRLVHRRFTKEDHLWLIRLLLPQVKSKQLYTDTRLVIQTLVVLLKKEDLLTREDLVIDWRPLFDLYIDVYYKKGKLLPVPKSLDTSLGSLVMYARKFFSKEAPQEILDTTRPFLFSDSSQQCWHLNFCFIPMNFPEDVQKTHGAGLWLEEAWHWYANILENKGETSQRLILRMFSRLAEEAPDYVKWSEERMNVIFTRLIRDLALPNSGISAPKKWTPTCQTLFVYLIGSSSHDCIMKHFNVLCTMLHSSCHPSNSGYHSQRIEKIICEILSTLVSRVRKERHAKSTFCQIPEGMKLQQSHLDEVVKVFMPCVELLIFSKVNTGASTLICSACALSPGVVFPMLLNITYPSLESVTEPHRLYQSLNVFTLCVGILVTDEKYRIHGIRLTKSLLPGIDINDYGKMVFAFLLVGTLLRSMKIADCSAALKERDGLTEEEKELCRATAGFKEIICGYVDRLLSLLETNGEACIVPTVGKANLEETVFDGGVILIFQSICENSSTNLYQLVFERFYRFVATTLFDSEAVCKTVGRLIAVVIQANVEYAFPRFLKLIIKKLKENISEQDYSEEKPPFAVFWWLHLTSSVLSANVGPMVHQHWDEIQRILKTVAPFSKTNRETKASNRVFLTLLQSMCGLYAVDRCNVSRAEMDRPLTEYLPIRDWSKPVDKSAWEMKWYVASPEIIAKVEEVFTLYFSPSLEALKAPEKLDKHQMLVHLWRVKNMFNGASFVIPLFKGPKIFTIESRTFTEPDEHPIYAPRGFPELSLDGQCLRSAVVDCLSPLLDYVLKHKEDDTKSIGEITLLLGMMDAFSGCTKANIASVKKTTWGELQSVNPLEPGQVHIPRLMEKKILLMQAERVAESAAAVISEQSVRVLRLLVRISTSSYPLNRQMAQRYVRNIVRDHHCVLKLIIDDILEYLDPNKEYSHEQIKGALHLIYTLKAGIGGSYKRKLPIWKAVILTRHNNKETIMNLTTNIGLEIQKAQVTLRFEYEVDEKTMEVAREVLPEESGYPVEKLEEEKKERERDYHALVEMLLELAKMEGIHWKQESLALQFLAYLLRKDMEMPLPYLTCFLDRLTNDEGRTRLFAIDIVSAWVRIHKPKSKKIELQIERAPNCGPKAQWPISYGFRADNNWVVYDEDALPKSDEEWNQKQFYGKSASGFYTWKEKIIVHAPLGEQSDRRVEDLSEGERLILKTLSEPQYIQNFKTLFAIEGLVQNDAADGGMRGFFIYLAKSFGHLILGPMQQLLSSLFPSARKADHRLATEIVFGLLVGSRLWRWEHQRSLWTWLGPLLDTVLDSITLECRVLWLNLVTYAIQTTDPRTLHLLIQFLFERTERSISSSNAFVLKTNISLLNRLVTGLRWRGCQLGRRMVRMIIPLMDHKINLIRQEVSKCLLIASLYDYRGIVKQLPKGLLPFSDEQIHEMYKQMLLPSWDEARREAGNGVGRIDPEILKGARRAFSSVVTFSSLCFANCRRSITPSMIRLLPLYCYYANDVGDQDLVRQCFAFATGSLRTACINPENARLLLGVAKEILESSESWWKSKLILLRYIHTVIVNNLFEFQKHHDVIRDMICAALQDAQLEVRRAAKDVLRDLFLTGFFSTEPLIKTFLNGFASNEIESHGAVLGLSACVLAAPYSVPKYLPSVLVALADLSRKSKLLQETVKQTVAEFRRTHQDSWHEHRGHFTEEQLEAVNGLLTSANYYV